MSACLKLVHYRHWLVYAIADALDLVIYDSIYTLDRRLKTRTTWVTRVITSASLIDIPGVNAYPILYHMVYYTTLGFGLLKI